MELTLAAIAAVSSAVAETTSRNAKIERLAELLRGAAPADAVLAVSWLSGELRQGRIGIGAAVISAARTGPAAESQLAAREVDEAFDRIAALSGPGSVRARTEALGAVFARATSAEQEFLARLLFGELRQGALEGIMADAVARAADVPAAEIRRAAQLAGDLPTVLRAVLEGGAAELRAFGVQLFRPIQPMLAQPAEGIDDAMQRLGTAALDFKLDGARVQVHRAGTEVRVYTRRLNDVTASLPELVDAVAALPARELVLDGEAIALREDGSPYPFQVTMSRFGSRVEADRLRNELPLSTLFFDCMYVDGETLLDSPATERFDALRDVMPAQVVVPRLVTDDAAAAAAFLQRALAAGHEGVVAKALDATYEAGRRGGAWLKVKQAHTLDLVVLAAEWGHGRRRGWLSNLHLGARDPESGQFAMVGKTFKGMTDAILEWQTHELLAREIGREGITVHVRPELVVEIAYEGVQTSPRYASGIALRFARLKRYRPDKAPDQADTLAALR